MKYECTIIQVRLLVTSSLLMQLDRSSKKLKNTYRAQCSHIAEYILHITNRNKGGAHQTQPVFPNNIQSICKRHTHIHIEITPRHEQRKPVYKCTNVRADKHTDKHPRISTCTKQIHTCTTRIKTLRQSVSRTSAKYGRLGLADI